MGGESMRSGCAARIRTAALAATLSLTLAACATLPPDVPGGWSFAAMGDTPYSPAEEARLPPMISAMNREPLSFVVRVGDIVEVYGWQDVQTPRIVATRLARGDASATYKVSGQATELTSARDGCRIGDQGRDYRRRRVPALKHQRKGRQGREGRKGTAKGH